MVEMTEVANILRNATKNSLLILDEIGRGTSTFDGLSIAWAVIEHISNKSILGAKTLFATHYHELTELEGKLEGVNNYCIAVKEQGDDIIFLRKIVKGGADKSYGIQVAKLAGVPVSVIKRSNEIVDELIGNDLAMKTKDISTTVEQTSKDLIQDTSPLEQYSMFSLTGNDDIINEIREMDLSRLTPIDAINKLYQMQNKIKDRI
jgi:DNA mismatch repair protein MutS